MSFLNDFKPGVVAHATGNDGIGPSDIIWGRFMKHANTRQARTLELDFTSEMPTFASAVGQLGALTYQDTGVTIQGSSVLDAGLEIAGNDADNDEGVIGSAAGAIAVISDTEADKKMVGFEISVSKASIADNALSFFAGLMEPGQVGANALVDDTGAVKDADFVGFSCLAADGDALSTVYRKAGGALQTVKADAATLVAGEYVKLGMVYDPSAPAERKITFYVNGVDTGTYVTATDIAAATFPDGETLGWVFATKVGAAAESKAHIRWVRVCQLRVR